MGGDGELSTGGGVAEFPPLTLWLGPLPPPLPVVGALDAGDCAVPVGATLELGATEGSVVPTVLLVGVTAVLLLGSLG